MHSHLNRFKNRKSLIALIAILGIVLITAGATYAWFTYSKSGIKENTITAGSIKFHYAEGSRTIEVDDMMPMTDSQGKAQNDYFEFTITSDTSRTVDIPYYITARRTDSSEASMDSVVKVYLTKVDDNNNETQVLLSKFGGLSGYTNSAINIPLSEKTLYNDTVLAGTQGYTQKYRLRMWIDYDAKYIVQEENQPDQYPLEDKSYALTVNVYSEGNDVGESTVTNRANTNIASISFSDSNVNFTLENDKYIGEAEMPDGETEIAKTIIVETENPNATVTCQKINQTTGALINDNGIKRLSTSLNLPLILGTNDFIITVTGEDGKATRQFNLSIIVHPFNRFNDDSWATIQYNVTHGNMDRYNIGDTKIVELGNNFGEHIVRVANKTSCEDAVLENPSLTSETACGFVVEFADIISKQSMDNTTSGGNASRGYPGANPMYNYVTNTVYNALPEDLRAVMKDTTVVSSHAKSMSNPNGLELDNNNNYISRNQKIYLLDITEINGCTEYSCRTYNTAKATTRQLDYYNLNDTAIKKYQGTADNWWLRSAYKDMNVFHYVYSSNRGNVIYNLPINEYGVSPAFRIG